MAPLPPALTLAVTADCAEVVVGHVDGQIRCVGLRVVNEGGKTKWVIPHAHKGEVTSIAISGKTNTLETSEED